MCANRNNRKIDRISNLPYEIRIHILSFLPTICSISTSVLSRDWKDVWKFVPTIIIDSKSRRNRIKCSRLHKSQSKESRKPKDHGFEFLANQLLLHYDYPVRSIRLHSTGFPCLSKFDSWIEAAARRQVCELDISLSQSTFNDPLSSLFSCQKLEVLKLKLYGDIRVRKTPNFSFDCLKVLHLRMMTPAIMEMIYSGCPILEELVLDLWLTSLDKGSYKIVVPTLKRLSIRCCNNMNSLRSLQPKRAEIYCEFQICCPALESVHIVGPSLLYNIVNLPFTKADVDGEPAYYFKRSAPFVELLNTRADSNSPFLSVGLQLTDIKALYMSGTMGLQTSMETTI